MEETEIISHPTQLWQKIAARLACGEEVVLATIIDRSGSGPRETGASMAVMRGGKTLGTVGGGLLEARSLEMADRVLHERLPVLRSFSLTGQKVTGGDMICGGEVEILVDFLDAGNFTSRRIFEQVRKNQEDNRSYWLLRSIRTMPDGQGVQTGLGLMDGNDFDPGSLDASCLDTERLRREGQGKEAILIPCGDVRCFIQPAVMPETVFIFGAGHIAQALAPICDIAGFRIFVIDDRREFACAERFPKAAGVLVTDSFRDCFDRLSIDVSGCVVIVTHGHAHDRTVLARALKTQAGYIGMIASRRKRAIVFDSLREEGVSEGDLARVHSPIGLDIGARTPGEIAVSIVAELVAVRAGKVR